MLVAEGRAAANTEDKSSLSPTSSEDALGSVTSDMCEGVGSHCGKSEGGDGVMSDSGDGVTHDCSRAVGEVSSGIYGGEDGVICEGEQFASDCGGGESGDGITCKLERRESVGGESDSGPEDISLTKGREKAMKERRDTARELKR